MPKIESPFVRELNAKGDYVCTPLINPGYEWVFEDEATMAIEKLHGTNVSVIVEGGQITSMWNRTARIPFFNRGKAFITKGLLESYDRGYLELPDGQWFGELVGPKVNGNPYRLKEHRWIPFATYARKKLLYKSWGKYPKNYETIRNWFKELIPLYCWKIHTKDLADEDPNYAFVEGIMFTHPDGRMAKLRKDMFDWWPGRRHTSHKKKAKPPQV